MIAEWIEHIQSWVGGGPDTRFTIKHTLPVSPVFAFLLWLSLIVWAFTSYRRCRNSLSRTAWNSLFGLRAAAITILVGGILAGWQMTSEITDKPDLLIIIDDSASMLQVDHYDAKRVALLEDWFSKSPKLTSRLDIAKQLLVAPGERLANWQRRYHLRVVRVASTSREMLLADDVAREVRKIDSSTEQGEHQATRLGEEIVRHLRAQRGRPLAAIIVMTDGVHTSGRSLSEAAEYAGRKSVPLFCIGVGDTLPNRDAEIREVLVDRTAFLGDLVQVDVAVNTRALAGETLTLHLRRKGQKEPIDTQRFVSMGHNQTEFHRLTFQTDALGEAAMTVQIEPVRDEVNLENNTDHFEIDIRDETIRVLYVQGYPNPDFRFLKMLLTRKRKPSDEHARAVDLTTVQFEAETGYDVGDAAAAVSLPMESGGLEQFDAVILGDVSARRLPNEFQEAMVTHVAERGMGVAILCGPRHTPHEYKNTPLARLFPFHLDSAREAVDSVVGSRGVQVRPTEFGLQQPAIQIAARGASDVTSWLKMPPLRWFVQTRRFKAAAQPWLEVHAPGTNLDSVPIVVSQYVGAGRVVTHLTDESYRWSRHENGEAAYESYWMQVLRYLGHAKIEVNESAIDLSADKEVYEHLDPVTIRARFFDRQAIPDDDHAVQIQLTRNGGEVKEFILSRRTNRRGVFDITIEELQPGLYRTRLLTPTSSGEPKNFRVRSPQGELEQLELNEADLRLAADVSGGRYARWYDTTRLLRKLPEGQRVHVSTLPPISLWNSHFLMLLLISCFATEWTLRRRWGLV
jgi:hypothetical protein